MRIPLTVCGLRSQFADFTYSCGFHDNLSLLNISIMICLWFHKLFRIPQILLQVLRILLRVPQSCLFWRNFEQYSVLAVCPWNSKQQRSKKKARLRNPQQFFFLLVFRNSNKCTVRPRNGYAPLSLRKIVRIFYDFGFDYTITIAFVTKSNFQMSENAVLNRGVKTKNS